MFLAFMDINSSGHTDSYIATGDAASLFMNDDVITFTMQGQVQPMQQFLGMNVCVSAQ